VKLSLLEKKCISREPSRISGSMESAAKVLHDLQPELIVSRQKLRQAESITLIREKRENRSQSLCFASRPFVLCGLPVRRLPPGQLLYERRNGRFTLQLTGHPEFGVPFGQDRIVPIFLATMAVRQKSPVLRFKSAAQMLETFGMQKGGKQWEGWNTRCWFQAFHLRVISTAWWLQAGFAPFFCFSAVRRKR